MARLLGVGLGNNFGEAKLGSVSAPSFLGVGTYQAGTGDITIPLPIGLASKDYVEITFELANNSLSIPELPEEWQLTPGSPSATTAADGGSGTTMLCCFWKRWEPGDATSVLVPDAGDHLSGQAVAFRGVRPTGSPFESAFGKGPPVDTNSTAVSIPGFVTENANVAVVAHCSTSADFAGPQFSALTNTSLEDTTMTTLCNDATAAGNGGGFIVAFGVKKVAGTVAASTGTLTNTGRQARLSHGLLPTNAPEDSATNPDPPDPDGILRPSSAWTGYAGTGGLPRSRSDAVFGPVALPERPSIAFANLIPYQWINEETIISVVGLPITAGTYPDTPLNYMDTVEFFCEGTTITVSDWTMSDQPILLPDGTTIPALTPAYNIKLGAGAGAKKSGEIKIYAFARGVYGMEERIDITLMLNADNSYSRPVRYMNYSTGNDSWDGTSPTFVSGSIGPWKTQQKFWTSAPAGARGICAAGTYVEDSNVGTVQINRFMKTIEPAAGLDASDVIVTRTTKNLPNWDLIVRCKRAMYINIGFEMSKISGFSGGAPASNVLGFLGCALIDSNGPLGPKVNGYSVGYTINDNYRNAAGNDIISAEMQTPLFNYATTAAYLLGCKGVYPTTLGGRAFMNSEWEFASDSITMQEQTSGGLALNFKCRSAATAYNRQHGETFLTVASSTFDGTNTLVVCSGDPHFRYTTDGGGNPLDLTAAGDLETLIVEGASAGTILPTAASGVVTMRTTKTVYVAGDQTAHFVAGVKFIVGRRWHSDAAQSIANNMDSLGIYNHILWGYESTGKSIQLMLIQGRISQSAYPEGYAGATISTVDTSFTSNFGWNFKPRDVIRLGSGAQAGESRFVMSFDPATMTGTLDRPYSVNQTNTPIRWGKTLRGLVAVNSIIRKWGNEGQIGQIQEGMMSSVITQSTIISDDTGVSHRNTLGATHSAHGQRDNLWWGNIISEMGASTGALAAIEGITGGRNQMFRGSPNWPTDLINDPLLDMSAPYTQPDYVNDTYLPGGTCQTFGQAPLVPFDRNGNAITSASPVGAVGS